MRSILAVFLPVFLLFATAFAQMATTQGGVTDGSVWKNGSGRRVTVDVKWDSHHQHAIPSFTDVNGNTGAATEGTPVPGTHNVQTSPEVQVGPDRYRVRQGGVEWEGPNGWVDMYRPGSSSSAFVYTSGPGDVSVIGTLP